MGDTYCIQTSRVRPEKDIFKVIVVYEADDKLNFEREINHFCIILES